MLRPVYLKISILSLLLVQLIQAQPDSLWSEIIDYGGHEYFTSLEKTSDGGFILAGFTEPLDGVSSDSYLLVRLDSAGDTLWVTSVLKEGGDGQSAFETLDGGFILLGEGDPWMFKTDANGNIEWQQPKLTVTGGLMLYGSAITADSGFVATGSLEGESMRSTYVVKTDKMGNVEWTKTYRDEHDMVGISITETSTGGYAIGGAKQKPTGGGVYLGMLLMLDADGDSLWVTTFGGDDSYILQDISETADGGFIMAGRQELVGEGEMPTDIFVVKTDNAGVAEWTKQFGGPASQEAMAIIQTANLGYSIAAMGLYDTTMTQGDAWITHLDGSGDEVWTVHIGGEYNEFGFDLKEVSDGEYLVAGGYLTDWETGDFNLYLLRLGTAVVAVEEKSAVPTRYALHPAYPNPFNPSTIVRFDLPVSGEISLMLYDLLGREVAELASGVHAAGTHQLGWDGRSTNGFGLPSGIYIARLTTPEYSKSIKMVLLK
ncbi:T9SS type A sorting domain-containing protein [Candidatus Neomarinimicrobiota bacterium]